MRGYPPLRYGYHIHYCQRAYVPCCLRTVTEGHLIQLNPLDDLRSSEYFGKPDIYVLEKISDVQCKPDEFYKENQESKQASPTEDSSDILPSDEHDEPLSEDITTNFA